MKTNNKRTRRSPLERELLSIYNDIYPDESSRQNALNDAMSCYSLVKQEAIHRKINLKNLYE